MKAPFIWFGGKRTIIHDVWSRFGSVQQYNEPFCGSAAVLLGAPAPASLEVVGDLNGFIANFWRAVKHTPATVAEWADYPVSHIDMGGRHRWLMEQRARLGAELHDPNWPGDPKVAGWWLWGQCSWIGSGWCNWLGQLPNINNTELGVHAVGQIPQVSDAGMGVHAVGQIPHVGNAGRGVQAVGQIPHVGNAGMGVQAVGKIPQVSDAGMGVHAVGKIQQVSDAGMGSYDHLLTTGGKAAWLALHQLAARLDRVRIIHGDWTRCLNHHYGAEQTAVFLDPPYLAFERLYGTGETPVAAAVCEWAREHAHLRVALCGHAGDYDLPGWEVMPWSRSSNSYGSTKTKDAECVWFSPACLLPTKQLDLGL